MFELAVYPESSTYKLFIIEDAGSFTAGQTAPRCSKVPFTETQLPTSCQPLHSGESKSCDGELLTTSQFSISRYG